MGKPLFDSVTGVGMRNALDSLMLRQQVIADNISNINTPGYLARRVTFEDSFANALHAGRGEYRTDVRRSLEPTRLDGNNVNLEWETLANIDTNLRYQVAIRSVDGEFSRLRTAMRMS